MGGADKKTILLVEDEAVIALTQKMVLEKYGYCVFTVNTGEKAVETIKNTPNIQLILMDIDLGKGIDGTEAAAIILQDRNIPVVFCSSHTEPEIVEKTEKITSYGYVVKSSSNTVLDASIKMAFKLFEANREIDSSRKIQAKMLSNIGDVIVIIDPDGLNKYKSPNIAHLFGWEPDELIGKSAWDVIHPDDRETGRRFVASLAAEPNATGTIELRYLRKDGQYVWIEITLVNLIDDPDIRGLLGNYHDITGRRKAEEELKESEERFKALHNASFGGICIHDKGKILECNQGLVDMTGYSTDELIGMDGLLLIAPDSRDYVREKIASGYEKPYEAMGMRKNGELFPMRLEARNVPYKGKTVRTVEFRNIAESKRAEDDIKSLLAEKELILREVNHRIKNNMNSMRSLLALQAAAMNDAATVAALEDAGKRMQSMEILYDQLYKSTSYSELSIKAYMVPLIDAVIANFPRGDLVAVEKNIGDFMLDAKRLQSIGIIINELLTNAMKYAFPDKSEARIAVSATIDKGHITIALGDNGIGIPESACAGGSAGFGLNLVRALAAQMDGTVRIERIGGTRITLEFER